MDEEVDFVSEELKFILLIIVHFYVKIKRTFMLGKYFKKMINHYHPAGKATNIFH